MRTGALRSARRATPVSCARDGRRSVSGATTSSAATTTTTTTRTTRTSARREGRLLGSRAHFRLRARAEPEAETKTDEREESGGESERTLSSTLDDLGLSLGPIGLTVGESVQERDANGYAISPLDVGEIDQQDQGYKDIPSIHSLTTEEWLEKYDLDNTVDLWLEDEYNAASRVPGGRAYGTGTGEARTYSDTKFSVKIEDPVSGKVLDVEVPEDRYILFQAEDAGLDIPWSCRMGCCTACAVKVNKGTVRQKQALGVSEELKREGYALMCVSYAESDLELELVEEDEIYDEQFGKWFEKYGTDPSQCERDDFALEFAEFDE